MNKNSTVQERQVKVVIANQASIDKVTSSILFRHLQAFKELAK